MTRLMDKTPNKWRMYRQRGKPVDNKSHMYPADKQRTLYTKINILKNMFDWFNERIRRRLHMILQSPNLWKLTLSIRTSKARSLDWSSSLGKFWNEPLNLISSRLAIKMNKQRLFMESCLVHGEHGDLHTFAEWQTNMIGTGKAQNGASLCCWKQRHWMILRPSL